MSGARKHGEPHGPPRQELGQERRFPWYLGKTPWHVCVFGITGVCMLLFSMYIAIRAWDDKSLQGWLYIHASFWALVPACWFWYEYMFLILPKNLGKEQFEEYKFAVQLGAAIWAAAAIGLASYASSDHFKADPAKAVISPRN